MGLVFAVDLESYDYRRVRTEIRATEDTIRSRLPVRMEIRKDAPLELPHIILLFDDEKKEIIEPLYENRDKLKKLYDFDLNMGGGHIAGYEVKETEKLIKAFDGLLDPARQTAKYGNDAGILFAVGDGNHSMATAKEHWNKLKTALSAEERENHPARFALVEAINVYDDALIFEPIHRVILNGGKEFAEGLKARLTSGSGTLKLIFPEGDEDVPCPSSGGDVIRLVQEYIEECIAKKGLEADYIHGEGHTREVVKATGGVGILMPKFAKSELFDYVINKGNLPKKAFSIGSAENKKYYIEAKRIK